MNNQIGVCDQCGGPVVVSAYSVWPTPHCTRCGAVAATVQPVIKMEPPKKKESTDVRG